MMWRKSKPKLEQDEAQPKGFDDFEVRLGDMMRGERATLAEHIQYT